MNILSNNAQVFAPIGRCIYCGSSGRGTLTKEHIIPIGIGGGLILPQASCTPCQQEINRFETICMRKIFLPFRRATGLVRHGSDLPKSIPLIFDLDLRGPTFVSLDEHPNVVVIPALRNLPGILAGGAPSNRVDFDYKIFAGVEIMEETQKRLEEQKRVGIGIDGFAWVRLLAKIAHGIAVAELGLEGFNPELPDLILGRNLNLASYLVGKGPSLTPEPDRPPLHQVSRLEAAVNDRKMVAVQIRLFAELGAEVPTNIVVAGMPV
ncbi:MAG TPA: HNH endonuclease [Aliidongia sp.]|uniref:HNH endonuclease n=1 Tax=Aliidongia sp. TaxID=1914230 RepID=UPI002DDCCC0C|nr:HNH endonuclease [Aliidongia sp.]HEV2676388.1 HNH endonuclease [Aliidongia sp.]